MTIFALWCSKKSSYSAKSQQVYDEVIKLINFECKEGAFCELLKCVQYLCKRIVDIWKKNHRLKSDVLKNHSDWSAKKEVVSLKPKNVSVSPKEQVLKANKRGRPSSDFPSSSKRKKQRRLAKLAETDATAADTLRGLCSEPNQGCSESNAAEVLALIIDTNLTKQQYWHIRNFENSKVSFSLFPSYEKMLSNKFTSLILLLLHVLIHKSAISVTAELTCQQCRGISCLRTNYELTQKCVNDLDICVNVFEGQTLLAQGCWEQLPEELRDKCSSDTLTKNSKELRECFKCNENFCNNLSSNLFECIQCDSDSENNCLTNPISLIPSRCAISRTPNEYCFVKKEGHRVIRGCAYNLEDQMSCLNNANCIICQPSELHACNNVPINIDDSDSESDHNEDHGPESDLGQTKGRICHQCNGFNCLRTDYKATQKCVNIVDICVTVFDDQTILAQGCWEQLSEEVRSKCDEDTQCLKCNENLCNNIASSSFKCLQCDSKNDSSCRSNPLGLVPLRCGISRTPNEYCFVKQEGERVVRGCSYSLEEQISCLSSDNCTICQPSEIDGCNNIEVGQGNGDSGGDSNGGTNTVTDETDTSGNGLQGSGSDEVNTEGVTSEGSDMPGNNDSNSGLDNNGTNDNNNEGDSDSGGSGLQEGSNSVSTSTLNTFILINTIIMFLVK